MSDSPSDKLYYLAFPLPQSESDRALSVIELIETSEEKHAYTSEFADVIMTMSKIGLHYMFIHPLEIAGINIITRKTASVSLNTAIKGVSVLIPRILKSMSDEQLVSVANFMRSVLIERDE